MPQVSVLIATYNRPELLHRAISSVLMQDFRDLELVVIDDGSDMPVDGIVASFGDPRIRLVRNRVNQGAEGGDVAVLRKFLKYYCEGEAFVYLCDDDYWLPCDLLSRQIATFAEYPNLAFAQGGMAQCYASPVDEIVPNEEYISYEFLDLERRQMFWRGLFPTGVMPGQSYLRLFAEDPKNRNIVVGATLFRTKAFRDSRILDRADGVRWQAGYMMLAGAATQGAVLYLDEPCVMTTVDATSASYRGTQLAHMLDALCSIDAAFGHLIAQPDYREVRDTLARSVLMIYVCNKIGHALGWFKRHALGDISDHFLPPILGVEFLKLATDRGIPLSARNVAVIQLSDGRLCEEQWPQILEMVK